MILPHISYSHKYITSQVMMFLCLLCFLLMIPLRLYDIHKYKPKQMKKRKDISVERLPSSFNQSSTIGLKQKSLSVSEYSEDDYKNDESVVSQEKSSIREESNYEDSPSAASRPSYNWKKKLGNGNQGDTIGSHKFSSMKQTAKFIPEESDKFPGKSVKSPHGVPEEPGFSIEEEEKEGSVSLSKSSPSKSKNSPMKKTFKLPPI